MENPYRVLGVRENAGEDEVREAYLKLAKKYHPDKYKDNPLADLAAEKMKEINAAYDAITEQRKSGSNGGYSSGGYSQNGSYQKSGGTNPFYANIRRMIDSNMIDAAMNELNKNPSNDAEWHFLMGCVFLRKGSYNQAYEKFKTASAMEPNNFEYNQAFMRMNNMGGQYRTGGGQSDCGSGCGCCSQLICADCCCECMGGDLISCC